MWSIEPAQLLIAIALDLLLGDPTRGPHVVRMTGRLAGVCEHRLSNGLGRTVFSGALFWLGVCGIVLAGYTLIAAGLSRLHPSLQWGWEILVLYQTFGAMDLQRHVRAIQKPLLAGNLEEARRRLGRIVGRDTDSLDETGVGRATIESIAEGSNDGFAAPLFWGVVAGAPGALLYRAANTLDSMVGYDTTRYRAFGRVSARIDDALSWIPARICAILLWLMRPGASWKAIAREARQHPSPNAGWSEAAMAHLLGVRLGGTSRYGGAPVAGPAFCPEGRLVAGSDIPRALLAMWGLVVLLTAAALWAVSLKAY